MGIEIERKFLLRSAAWRGEADHGVPMVQAYLGGDRCSVRLRIEGELAFLNIKSKQLGVSRLEYEYPVPRADAQQMLDAFAGARVEKVRYCVRRGRHVWEIDEFLADNAGLVVAELELGAETEVFERPDWLGREVTEDPRYYNVALAKQPFSGWPDRTAIMAGH